MANPFNYLREGVREAGSYVSGNPYDARDPGSKFYGVRKAPNGVAYGETGTYQANPGQDFSNAADSFRQSVNNSNARGGGNYGGSYGGGGGYDAAAAAQAQEQGNIQAQYDDQINQLNGQAGQLDGQQNIGQSNINNAYKEQQNAVEDQYGRAKRNYGIQTADNTQSYINNRNSIQTGVRANSSALQRLLGMAGAGSSSAAREQAPYAAALQGSQQLQGAQQSYGKNDQNLNIAWGDTTASYKKNLEGLDAQKFKQEQGLKGTIASTRASLLEKLANSRIARAQAGGADYKTAAAGQQGSRDQVNSLLSQITNLGNQYQNSIQATGPVDFKAGPLSEYQMGRRATPQNPAGGAESNVDPSFLNLLAGQKRDRNGQQV